MAWHYLLYSQKESEGTWRAEEITRKARYLDLLVDYDSLIAYRYLPIGTYL